MSVSGATIKDNVATNNGGGIYFENSGNNITIKNIIVTGNKLPNSPNAIGAGILHDSGTTVSLAGALICKNNRNGTKASNYGIPYTLGAPSGSTPGTNANKIQITGRLSQGGQSADIGVSLLTYPVSTNATAAKFQIATGYSTYNSAWAGSYFSADAAPTYAVDEFVATHAPVIQHRVGGFVHEGLKWWYLEEVDGGTPTWKQPGTMTVGSYTITNNILSLNYDPNRKITGIWLRYENENVNPHKIWNVAIGDGVASNSPPSPDALTGSSGDHFIDYTDTVGGSTFTYAQDVGSYSLGWDSSTSKYMNGNYILNCAFTIQIKPLDVTVTMNAATGAFGEKLVLDPSDADTAKKLASVTSGSAKVEDLGLKFTKTYGTDVGEKNIILPIGWTNKNYNVTFVGSGSYTVAKRDVTVILNDDYITYGSATAKEANVQKTALNGTTSILTKTINKTNKFKDKDGKDVSVVSPATPPQGAATDYYKGGWYYSTDIDGNGKVSLQFIGADTNNGTDFSKIFEYEITNYAATTDKAAGDTAGFLNAKKYTVKVKNISEHYNITFVNAQTGPCAGTTGEFTFEVRKAEFANDLKTSTSTPKYNEADNDGTAKTIALPTDTLTLQGYQGATEFAAITQKHLVYTADTIPTNLKDTNKANWADETKVTEWGAVADGATASKTDAGTYTVFTLVKQPNHNAKVYKWTFTIGANKIKYRLIISTGKDSNGKDIALQPVSGLLQQAYKKGSAVTVSVQYEWDWDTSVSKPSTWDADNAATPSKGPDVKIYYLGTDTDNKHGAAAGDGVTYPDDSKKADGTTPAGLGSLTAPEEGGEYTATLQDKATASNYKLEPDT
ncbi:MAG: DUF1565 domain-containing protein, partial [Clostridia bacterium]|nr:DUF1565 domain-containing protein [Clostridia bacterium]